MIHNPDLINGLFEASAGLWSLNNCRVLYAHKAVRGVSVASTVFFTLWGVWNLYYYPAIAQPWSFYGGLVVVAANAIYVGMLVHYSAALIRAPGVCAHNWWQSSWIKERIGKAVCCLRGHHYDAPYFHTGCLYFCTRCGREIAGRTWDDIEPLSDEDREQLEALDIHYLGSES